MCAKDHLPVKSSTLELDPETAFTPQPGPDATSFSELELAPMSVLEEVLIQFDTLECKSHPGLLDSLVFLAFPALLVPPNLQAPLSLLASSSSLALPLPSFNSGQPSPQLLQLITVLRITRKLQACEFYQGWS